MFNNNNRLDISQANSCVKRYSFLSPRLTSSFSNYSQRTECDLSSSTLVKVDKTADQLQTESSTACATKRSSFFSFFGQWRASCESSAMAKERKELAAESLKQAEAARSSLISEMEIQNYLSKETGWERLFHMYTRDHLGDSSPEFQFIYQVTVQGGAGSFLIMSALAGRQAKLDFIEQNTATVFKTRFQAFRRLQDSIFLFSLKEGFKWSVRVSLFSLAFLGISQTVAVYRNKSSVWEYVLAGGATMGLLKANMGLRAFAVTTGLGSTAGLLVGVVVLLAMRALNETQEQRHFWWIHKQLERQRFFEQKGSIKVPDSPAKETM